MAWFRRSAYLFATFADDHVRVFALPTDELLRLTREELDELLTFSSREWTWRTDERPFELARRGLLVCDEPEAPYDELRARDEILHWWSPRAALFHLGSRWRGIGRDVGFGPWLSERIEELGPPPPAYHDRGPVDVELPAATHDTHLAELLRARRTRRDFTDEPLALDELSIVLREVWGVNGTTSDRRGLETIRRSSPSGGGLHPIEAYPLVIGVEGLEPGLYHYRPREHALTRLRAMSRDDARSAAEVVTAGQWYLAAGELVVVMTARFERSFFKYQQHAKALRVLLLEAGHFSQTFYLVCTELGLGPFVTGAVNDVETEELLGLDPLREGVLAACGCGRPAAETRFEREVLPLD